MALADPQSVNHNGSTVTLPRKPSTTLREGVFSNSDDTLTLRVSHSPARKGATRSIIELKARKISSDPLTSLNREVGMRAYLVIEAADAEFNQAEQLEAVKALNAYVAGNTFAQTVKIIGGEA